MEIVDFEPGHAAAFHDLNVAWISKYFAIEAKDREVLENPRPRSSPRAGASSWRCRTAAPSAAWRC